MMTSELFELLLPIFPRGKFIAFILQRQVYCFHSTKTQQSATHLDTDNFQE